MLPPHIARVDYGAGSAQDIAKAYDSYLAVSMDVPWAITRDVLGKPPRQLHLVQSVNFGEVDRLAETTPAVDRRWTSPKWSVIDEREIATPFVAAALEDLRTA